MSLLLWLPLNGEIKNQGIATYSVVSSPATLTYSDNAKLNKSLNLTPITSPTYTFQLNNYTRIEKFTICFWGYAESSSTATSDWNRSIKFTDANNNKSGTGLFRFESTYTSSPRAFSWHNNNGYNLVSTGDCIVGPNKDTWYHISVTYDGTKLCTYRNGELVNTNTNGINGYLTGRIEIGSSTFLGQINDLRLYDEVLSPTQIKEISKGLVLHYKLDGKFLSDSNIYDVSGYNKNGVYFTTKPTLTTNTPMNTGALTINGSTALCKCTEDIVPAYTQSLTVSLWFKYTADNNGKNFFSIRQNWGFRCRPANGAGSSIWTYVTVADSPTGTTNTASQTLTLGINTNDGNWHHFVNIFDKGTNKIYLDGELDATGSFGKSWLRINKSDYIELNIGSYNGTGEIFNGSLSDFRIYTTVLSDVDIEELYNKRFKMDSNHNVLVSGEIVEDDSISFNKNGVLKTNIVTNNDNKIRFLNNTIYSNDIIEY